MASFYISDGIKSYSKLGKLCPVTLQSDKCIGLKNIGSIPVEYENHIIFLKDQYSLNLFIKSPSLYLTNEKLKPMIFPTFCIVGNPKSGKTTLSKAIAEQFDLAVLTIANIIVSIMESDEGLSVAQEVWRSKIGPEIIRKWQVIER
jgi:stage III sporulation protein SpoIIIAA